MKKIPAGAADDALAQTKLSPHLQDAETHVDAIEVSHDVEEERKRHQPPHQSRNTADSRRLGVVSKNVFR